MGKRQAAQIAALERMLLETGLERDRWRAETQRLRKERDLAYEFIGDRRNDTSLVDVARREFTDRWGWILDLAGFGK